MSDQLSDKSRDTAEITVEGLGQMEELSQKMTEIDQIVSNTSHVMGQVNEENKKITALSA